MMRSMALIALTGLLAAAGSAPAFAQAATRPGQADTPLFVDLNAGIASKPDALTTATTFALFGENGSAATRIESGTSAMFDVRLGYMVTPRIGVAAAVSGGRSDITGATTASVPSPIRFASPTIVSLDAGSASRREIGLHLQLVYGLPLSDTVTLSIAGGPSIVHLQQGVPNVSVTGGTPTAVSVNESGSGLGGNVGADLSARFSAHYGVGVFFRYVGASIDLPSASGVTAGGVQAGAGLRIRF
jgi:Outer membrane protein beta-barrel domain